MLWAKCGTESTSGSKFCPECSRPLTNRCVKCGADNSPAAKFCEDSGTRLECKVHVNASYAYGTELSSFNVVRRNESRVSSRHVENGETLITGNGTGT
jgi:hypothetical protein